MSDRDFTDVIRKRYGDGTYRPPLRLLLAESYTPKQRRGGDTWIAIILLAGAAGVGFWCAVGILYSMGWLR